jgi:hypothetical protein
MRDEFRCGSGGSGDRRDPGISGEGVADGGEDGGAVLCGGGGVAADRVPVAGGLSERSRPLIFCWVFEAAGRVRPGWRWAGWRCRSGTAVRWLHGGAGIPGASVRVAACRGAGGGFRTAQRPRRAGAAAGTPLRRRRARRPGPAGGPGCLVDQGAQGVLDLPGQGASGYDWAASSRT